MPSESRPLTPQLIRALFDSLSGHLREADSYNHHLMIAGGAALALRWDHRLTRDVDVLDHRLRWEDQRHTSAVDFISMRFPPDLRRAATRTAVTYDLDAGWLNNAVGLYTPLCDLEAEVLYRSDTLTIESPAPRIPLAMKLHARRDKDLDDAARLIAETGISDEAALSSLVAEAFGAEAVTPETGRFVASALTAAAADASPPPRSRTTGAGHGPFGGLPPRWRAKRPW